MFIEIPQFFTFLNNKLTPITILVHSPALCIQNSMNVQYIPFTIKIIIHNAHTLAYHNLRDDFQDDLKYSVHTGEHKYYVSPKFFSIYKI